jgi:hypothetical protein
MAQEQLIRSYPSTQMPRVFESDWRELGRKGWTIAQRRDGGGVTTVTYRRESLKGQAVAPVPSPLPTALEPLPPEVRRYSQLETLILVIGYVLALTVFLAGGSALFNWIAALLFLGTSAYALAIDWYGVVSLRGQIPWTRLSGGAHAVVIAGAIITAPVYMAYYAGRVVWQYVLRKNVVSPWRIAQLEARLGITPPTVGTCRKCGKPLQVGAEFCSYCGETVIEYPRICPKCATVCLPDAQFCPKCRTPLTA